MVKGVGLLGLEEKGEKRVGKKTKGSCSGRHSLEQENSKREEDISE